MIFLSASVTKGQLPPYTKSNHLWLARAMVAEAGWTKTIDHAAIAHVLGRRWNRAKQRFPNLRFEAQIRGYCSGLYRMRTSRHIWLHNLTGSKMPLGWPVNRVSWDRHKPLWKAALERAKRYFEGELVDPCRGKAWNWGGGMDLPKGPKINCGKTVNIFTK